MAKSIAIVEDDPDQRANYADAISKKGYQVAAYGSREEALQGISQQQPDLVQDLIRVAGLAQEGIRPGVQGNVLRL